MRFAVVTITSPRNTMYCNSKDPKVGTALGQTRKQREHRSFDSPFLGERGLKIEEDSGTFPKDFHRSRLPCSFEVSFAPPIAIKHASVIRMKFSRQDMHDSLSRLQCVAL